MPWLLIIIMWQKEIKLNNAPLGIFAATFQTQTSCQSAAEWAAKQGLKAQCFEGGSSPNFSRGETE